MWNSDPSQIFDSILHLELFVFSVFPTANVGIMLVSDCDLNSELPQNHKSLCICSKIQKIALIEVIFAYEGGIVTGRGGGEVNHWVLETFKFCEGYETIAN